MKNASFFSPEERQIARFLRELPDVSRDVLESVRASRSSAEAHGVQGLVHDAWVRSREVLDPETKRAIDERSVASELDYGAHLAMLARIDTELAEASVRGVALKGVLLAQRLYPRPSARLTTDIDLLVEPRALGAATRALARVGYVPLEGAREEWFRENHHHLHFTHAHAPPVELHFHAYRGFGSVLPSAPLIERSRRDAAVYRTLAALAPEDELVYLAVHAAGHRFVRLGWLYDCKLLLATMTDAQLATARARARAFGFARPVALAAGLLVSLLGVEREKAGQLGTLDPARAELLYRLVGEPSHPLVRSATRLLYTTCLAPSGGAALRYALGASRDRLRRAFG